MTCENEIAVLFGEALSARDGAFLKGLCIFYNGNAIAAYLAYMRQRGFIQLKDELKREGISSSDIEKNLRRIRNLYAQGQNVSEIARFLKYEMKQVQRSQELAEQIKQFDPSSASFVDDWVSWHESVEAELDLVFCDLNPPATDDERAEGAKKLAIGVRAEVINAELKNSRPNIMPKAADSSSLSKKRP